VTTFLDGPAAGQCLMLRRAPLFLRAAVDRSAGATWGALDQVEDVAPAGLELVAYRRVGPHGLARLPRGEVALAKYRVMDPQPDAATMRDTAAWQAWCLARVKGAQ
jgi:hypothetical protein